MLSEVLQRVFSGYKPEAGADNTRHALIVAALSESGTTCSTYTVRNWIRGERAPDAQTLEALLTAMGATDPDREAARVALRGVA